MNINGCEFLNTINSNRSGYGIFSIDGGFSVNEHCTEYVHSTENNCLLCIGVSTPSVFSGFNRAVSASNSQTSRTVIIQDTYFSNNATSVYISAVNNYHIVKSNFNLNGNSSQTTGIHSTGCSGYKIEQNAFYKNTGSNSARGIYVRNSSTAENLIYRNDFSGLTYAIYASGTNGIVSNPPSGLQFQCNEFSGNTNDIYVANNSIVRSLQGSLSVGAGNQFSANASRNFFNNSANYPIIYYYSSGLMPQIVNNVTTYMSSKANTCKSKLCEGGGIQYLRKGNPDWIEYDYLDNIRRNFLNQFYANGYDVILDSLAQNPGYTIAKDILLQALAMRDTLTSLSCTMAEISDNVLKELLMDTTQQPARSGNNLEMVRNWQRRINTPVAKYDLVETNYQMGDYETAAFVLNKIPDWFELDEEAEAEHENYIAFFNFKNGIRLSGRNWSQLTEDEIAQLQILAENSTGRSSSMAKGVLCFFYDICYDFEEEPSRGSSDFTTISENIAEISNIIVYPNPTNDIIYFEWTETEAGNVSIQIYNMMGQLVQTLSEKAATKGKQHFEINLKGQPNGIYYYKVETGTQSVNGKIVKM